MHTYSFFLFGLAMGLQALVTMRNSAAHSSIRLSRGLLLSLVIAVVESGLLVGGMALSRLWRFQVGRFDEYVFLGIMLLLVAKQLLDVFGKGRTPAVYDIEKSTTALLLSVAMGIDTFIAGLAMGFLCDVEEKWLPAVLFLGILVWLLAYIGIMFGRQQVQLKQRRIQLFAILFLLIVAFLEFL